MKGMRVWCTGVEGDHRIVRKGFVERKNGVYQDRLVKELKLKGIRENDWTIQYQNHLFQIRRENKVRPSSGHKVVVRQNLEGVLILHYKGEKVVYDLIEARPHPLESVGESYS